MSVVWTRDTYPAMLITFLRHGQSEHNAGITTHLDSGLTPLGFLQASATAEQFRMRGFNIENTRAFVSPFMRTLQTVEPTVRTLDIAAEVFTDVCEYFSVNNDGYNTFEGLSPAYVAQRFPWALIGSRFNLGDRWWPERRETDVDLYARACRVRDHLTAEFFTSPKRLLIVSHADPIGRMIESFQRIEPSGDRPPWSSNCGITTLELSSPDSAATIVELNNTEHLAALSLESPRQ